MKKMGHLETYDLTLTTISPVHVGDDNLIKKKMYYTNRDRTFVHILNLEKWARFLLDHGLLDAYEDFMTTAHPQKTLNEFARIHRITDQDISPLTQYIVQNPHGQHRLEDIHACVKTTDDRPYIPGSTLKGAIRTALLVDMILNMPPEEKATWIQNIDRAVQDAHQKENIEHHLLHSLNLETIKKENALNSIMRGVLVSDSQALSRKALILATKNDINALGQGKGSKIPIYREAVKPGTTIKAQIRLDTNLLAPSGLTIQSLKDALANFAKLQDKVYYSKFPTDNRVASGHGPKDLILYLGGGVGFVNKTILYAFGEKEGRSWTNQILEKQFKGKRTNRGLVGAYKPNPKVAPYMRKMTELPEKGYKIGKRYDMGKCRVQIQ